VTLGDNSLSLLSDDEFQTRLDRLGPFEARPLLAVAVSGGADSLALTLLADRWARRRGGGVVALTVDHRLRAEAAGEARQVAAWLKARGIPHRTLVWDGPRPGRGVQAAARAARYGLLEGWCREHGCLHLFTAHHQEDQAETFWLRLARGSGVDGLAAMSGETPRAGCRILRPLLDVAPARLRAVLAATGQAWIEDPSNENTDYARVRVRGGRALLATEGLSGERVAATVARLGRARVALESATAQLLGRAVRLHPAGFAWVDAAALAAAPAELGLRGLAAVVATVGGEDYPPRLSGLERLYGEIVGAGLGRGRTLGGCRVAPGRQGVLVCREAVALQAPTPAPGGAIVIWDGRFRAMLASDVPEGLMLGALGGDGRRLPAALQARLAMLPGPVRTGLPALRRGRRLVAVPALEPPANGPGATRNAIIRVWFRPLRPLSPAGFTVV
jgi:tRNA(Ile)-lysidine synthase